ncbi:hypothetical protein AB3G45_24285 [Shinella sp. S4-D37]|uniref:hypothetical protein n=1 Tax=Shinella sp. S4-D37 TaxID=3161999 RepID=UPI0034662A8D
MIEITDEEWELLKQYFGDLAYEEPHNHGRFLAVNRGLREIEAGEVEDIDDVLADMDAIIASGDITPREALRSVCCRNDVRPRRMRKARPPRHR